MTMWTLLTMAMAAEPRLDGGEDFAAALYEQVAAKGDANVVISPTSARAALLMTWAGADGSTRDAMARALEISGDDALEQYTAWSQAMEVDGAPFELRVANRLWGSDQLEFHDDYLAVTRDVFGAQLERIDVSDSEGSTAAINQWCSDQTKGKLPELLPPDAITPDTSLVLTNAVYFLGNWVDQFNAEYTRPRPFTRADGSVVETPLMYLEVDAQYGEVGKAKVIRLPYDGDRLWFVGVLPDEGPALDELGTIDGKWLRTLPNKTKKREDVQITLPSFELELSYTLNDALIAMGMGQAFTDAADFSKITSASTKIDSVIQKTFVKLDEKGTEAAAATAVKMVLTSMPMNPPPPPPKWTADRPFLFYIWDDETQEILFLGHVGDPTE